MFQLDVSSLLCLTYKTASHQKKDLRENLGNKLSKDIKCTRTGPSTKRKMEEMPWSAPRTKPFAVGIHRPSFLWTWGILRSAGRVPPGPAGLWYPRGVICRWGEQQIRKFGDTSWIIMVQGPNNIHQQIWMTWFHYVLFPYAQGIGSSHMTAHSSPVQGHLSARRDDVKSSPEWITPAFSNRSLLTCSL